METSGILIPISINILIGDQINAATQKIKFRRQSGKRDYLNNVYL